MNITLLLILTLVLLLTLWVIYQLSQYQRRKLLTSSIRRALRWEFWPMWLFYVPVAVQVIGLSLRHRGLTFTAANPGLPGSGLIGERKSLCLTTLQHNHPEHTARGRLIRHQDDLPFQLQQIELFMNDHQLSYPIIAKPDFGQRGIDVKIVHSKQELVDYLNQSRYDTIVQEYVQGEEFGVFYVRLPDTEQGEIFSITHKCFPELIGDGESTLRKLILEDPRTHYMARYLLDLHKDKLDQVLNHQERFTTVHIGSHCRGSLFLDGQQYHSDSVRDKIDQISQALPGFFFGRYDLRSPSIEAFMNGEFKVLEVNGVTSEATHIYDPKHGLVHAYKVLFRQWQMAFHIGRQNMRDGHRALTLSDILQRLRIMNRET